jgi:hypothetical protein
MNFSILNEPDFDNREIQQFLNVHRDYIGNKSKIRGDLESFKRRLQNLENPFTTVEAIEGLKTQLIEEINKLRIPREIINFFIEYIEKVSNIITSSSNDEDVDMSYLSDDDDEDTPQKVKPSSLIRISITGKYSEYSDISSLFEFTRDWLPRSTKTAESTGVSIVVYRQDDYGNTYMIPVIYTVEQVVSDNGHDFNGKRPGNDTRLQQIALAVHHSTSNFFSFKGESESTYDKEALTKCLELIENRKNVFMITADDGIIREKIHELLQSATTDRIQGIGIAGPLTEVTNYSDGFSSSAASVTGRLAKTELLARNGNNLDVIKDILQKKHEEKPIATESQLKARIASKPNSDLLKLLVNESNIVEFDIDQGVSHSLLGKGGISEKIILAKCYDTGRAASIDMDMNLKRVNTSFKIGIFALNQNKEQDRALFIEPKIDDDVYSLKTTFFTSSMTTLITGLTPSIGNLTYLVQQGLIELQHAMIAKFAADRLSIINQILALDGENFGDKVEHYFMTHDARAFADNSIITMLDMDKTPYTFDIPGVFTRITSTKENLRSVVALCHMPKKMSAEQKDNMEKAKEDRIKKEAQRMEEVLKKQVEKKEKLKIQLLKYIKVNKLSFNTRDAQVSQSFNRNNVLINKILEYIQNYGYLEQADTIISDFVKFYSETELPEHYTELLITLENILLNISVLSDETLLIVSELKSKIEAKKEEEKKELLLRVEMAVEDIRRSKERQASRKPTTQIGTKQQPSSRKRKGGNITKKILNKIRKTLKYKKNNHIKSRRNKK